MPKHDLVDVDVSGVHFVGSPANRKRFALVKNLEGQKPKEETVPDKRTFKKSELLQKLEAAGDTVTIDDLSIILGGRGAIAKDDDDTDVVKDEKGEKITKADLLATIAELQKSQKTTAEALATIVTAQKDATEAALNTRREALKKAGIPVPDKASADVVDALEKANHDIVTRLEKAGVLRQHGDSSRSMREAGLQEIVTKAVERRLGRPPIGKDEDVRERLRIYRANPGLLTQVVKEERKRRSA